MRTGRMLALVAAAALLMACSNQTAKNAVKGLLNDPDSAQFSGLVAGKEKGDVCGYVNAKNRMGGYAGNAPFFYEQITDTVAIVKAPEDSDFRGLWLDLQSGGTNRYVKLATQCNLVKQLESICGIAFSLPKHQLCEVIHDPSELHKALKIKYG